MQLRNASGEILRAQVEDRVGGVRRRDLGIDVSVNAKSQPICPQAPIGCGKSGGAAALQTDISRAGNSAVVYANDQRVGSAIQEVVMDGERHRTVTPQSAKDAFVFRKTDDSYRAIGVR